MTSGRPSTASTSDMEKSEARGSVLALSNDRHEPTVLEGPDLNDTRNPQNWSPWTKRAVFLALMSSSILADGYANYTLLEDVGKLMKNQRHDLGCYPRRPPGY